MIAPLLDLNRRSAIAHRGGSKLRPENTLLAFDYAVSLGVDALECDVHLSRDGEPVVIHDPTLERTTDAHGPVGALTAPELARVDAGCRFAVEDGAPFRGQTGVPRLEEVLERYRQLPLVIEIKGDRVETAHAVIALVRSQHAVSRVIIGGFSRTVLDVVRRALPDVVTSASRDEARQALTRSYFGLSPRRPAYRLFQMPFRLNGRQIFRRSFVHAARRAGVPVQSWIVDDPADMRRLLDWGVTGIISDRPDLALRELRELRELRIENCEL